jgi:hypothetical protein
MEKKKYRSIYLNKKGLVNIRQTKMSQELLVGYKLIKLNDNEMVIATPEVLEFFKKNKKLKFKENTTEFKGDFIKEYPLTLEEVYKPKNE